MPLRVLAPLLLAWFGITAVACGGDDGGATSTPTATGLASGSPTGSTAEGPWAGELNGPVGGPIIGRLQPQCETGTDGISVTLNGAIGGTTVVINIRSGEPGTFDLTTSADESPAADVATTGDFVGEWFAAAGAALDGELTIDSAGTGALSARLPSITTATQEPITVSADWTCRQA